MGSPNGAEIVGRLLSIYSGLQLLVTDVGRARREQEINRLRELVELKSAFLRLSVHELRRPLGLSHGHLSMLLDGTYGEIPDRARSALCQLDASNDEMANLIDGLAVAARLEDHAEALDRAPTRLSHLVGEVVAAAQVEATAKSVRIVPRLPANERELEVDSKRLHVAIANLLSNAIKFSPENSVVTIEISSADRHVLIAVADQGPGVPTGEMGRIFEPWQRSSTVAPGLGLGLHIVRTIVELHGGRVTVESKPGQGAIFTIALPR